MSTRKPGNLAAVFTDLVDAQDMPVTAAIEHGAMTLMLGTGRSIQFQMPHALLAYVTQGADFWIGNIGGSGEAWLISVEMIEAPRSRRSRRTPRHSD